MLTLHDQLCLCLCAGFFFSLAMLGNSTLQQLSQTPKVELLAMIWRHQVEGSRSPIFSNSIRTCCRHAMVLLVRLPRMPRLPRVPKCSKESTNTDHWSDRPPSSSQVVAWISLVVDRCSYWLTWKHFISSETCVCRGRDGKNNMNGITSQQSSKWITPFGRKHKTHTHRKKKHMHGLWQRRCSVIGVKVKVRVAAAIPKCPKLSGWWTSISSLPFPYIMTSPSCPFSYFSSLLFPYYVRINSLFSQLHYFPLCYSLSCPHDFSLRPHDFSLFSLPLWFSYVHSYFRWSPYDFPNFYPNGIASGLVSRAAARAP